MTEYPLNLVVDHGDMERVRELIDIGVNINGCISSGEKPLLVAARRGRSDIFDIIIQNGAQVNCGIDGNGWTPLHWSSFNGWGDQVWLILEKRDNGPGVDLNAAANEGETPLLQAAKSERRGIFDLLIQHGAKVNCKRESGDWTPLHGACSEGWQWVDQVQLILEKGENDPGADLNAAENNGYTPLTAAASYGRRGPREIFDLLLQYGAQVNCVSDGDDWTPFHWACANGWVDEVRLVLEKGGADLNAASKYGETPLILAGRIGHIEIFDLLIQSGARVNCGRDSDGWTPLHWACSNGWVDQVRLILEKGSSDLNAATKNGETPLIVAAIEDHRDIFDLLIQRGAQVNCKRESDGWTPLHWACSKGWVDQVRHFLEKGKVDLNAASNYGSTPLTLAAIEEHRDIFDLLIQYGAQVNNCESDGWTPLHFASCYGWADQVRLILEKGGSDLNAAANDEDTPLKLALEGGHREVCILLFQYGETMDVDYVLISNHSFLEVLFKDVNLCTQSIVNKFHWKSLPSLYRNPDLAKKLPFSKNFKLKDQQKQEIAKFVESEVKTKTFCNVFNSQPIVLMLLCVHSLLSHRSTRKMSASSDSNLIRQF